MNEQELSVYAEQENDITDILGSVFGIVDRQKAVDSSARTLFDCQPTSNRLTVKRNDDFLGGVDTLELGYDGDYEDFDNLRSFLEEKQAEARQEKDGSASFRLGKLLFKCLPAAARVGRVVYRFQLLFHGLEVLIHSEPNSGIQPIRIKVGGAFLLRVSLDSLQRYISYIFEHLGFKAYREIISRADLMCMLPISISEVVDAMNNNVVTTECRGAMSIYSNLATKEIETIHIYSRTTELCIYNKIAELEKKSADYYRFFLAKYGFYLNLTRFEYRFKRAVLKRWGIDTISELIACSASLLNHFTFDWFRIHQQATKGNECRAKLSSLWQKVRDTFNGVFSCSLSKSIVRALNKKSIFDLKRHVKFISGYISSVTAYIFQNKTFDDNDIFELLAPLVDDIKEKSKKKSEKYAFDI